MNFKGVIMNNDFIQALYALESEKGIQSSLILSAVEAALKSAYKKNYNTSDDIEIKIDKDSGAIEVYSSKLVVDQVIDYSKEISLEDAHKINENLKIGDKFISKEEPKAFGRIAAQTARQVVTLKLREAEKEAVYKKYEQNKSEIITGVVERIENDNYILSIEKTKAILPIQGQITNEKFQVGDRVKGYIATTLNSNKNNHQIVIYRNNIDFLKRLFELEIPEIKSGEVEIKSIAREAGQRSKVAVYSNDELLDPIGSCIGEEGVRVKAIVNELNGEKIDIVQWSESPEEYIAASLSPSNVIDVQIITDSNNITKALVVVPDEHLSLAIGKEGQNARLAAKLTSWRIDIKSETQTKEANISYQFRFLPKR